MPIKSLTGAVAAIITIANPMQDYFAKESAAKSLGEDLGIPVRFKRRAKPGGEIGVNGFFYPGGAFLPSREDRLPGSNALAGGGGGKVEIEPWKRVDPKPGYKPIYQSFWPGVMVGKMDNGLWGVIASNQTLAYYFGDESEQYRTELQALADRYNRGERWLKIDDPSAVVTDDMAEPVQAVASQPLTIIEHTTGRGKIIRGVVRKDISGNQASEIDPYTFRKDGGWFIREKHLDAMAGVQVSPAAASVEQAVQKAPEQTEEQKQAIAQEQASARQEQARMKAADRLRAVADKMLADAESELGRDRNTNTARRARMAGHAISSASHNSAIAKTMGNLADAIAAGQADKLAGLTSRTQTEMLDSMLKNAQYQRWRAEGKNHSETERLKGEPLSERDIGYVMFPQVSIHRHHAADIAEALAGKKGYTKASAWAYSKGSRAFGGDSVYILDPSEIDMARTVLKGLDALGKKSMGWNLTDGLARIDRLNRMGIRNTNDLHAALKEYLQFRDGGIKEDPVKAAERKLVGQKVGLDFFPTPKSLAQRMVELAGVKEGDRVLEPSAGSGNIADAAKAAGAKVDTIEVSYQLRELLGLKGHNIIGNDFEMEDYTGRYYDAVLMNPPFSDRKDALHIMRAFDLLKKGGTLVAIAGEGVFFGSDAKAVGFRDWLKEHKARIEKLPEGTFLDKSLLATTGANARLIVMTRRTATGEVTSDDHLQAGGAPEPATADAAAAAQVPTGAADPDAFTLAAQTEEDRRAKEAADKAALAKVEQERIAAERKVQADREAADFKLTGSDRPADVAMAAGQGDLFAPKTRGQKEAEKQKTTASDKSSPAATDTAGDDMDPNSPNYRYRDTGYIADSRKEKAQDQIRASRAAGQMVGFQMIDWAAIEENPRAAKELITKSNLFGKVDWDALKAGGMTAEAGFLIDRIYASIGTEPSTDGPMGRKDYAVGIQSIRDRLEKSKTANDVLNVLAEIRDEFQGTTLNADEAAQVNALRDESAVIRKKILALEAEHSALKDALFEARRPLTDFQREQEKRARRGWKPDPEIAAKIAPAEAVYKDAEKALQEWEAAHPEIMDTYTSVKTADGGLRGSFHNPLKDEYRGYYQKIREIEDRAKQRNLLENQATRSWLSFGSKFFGVLNYRSARNGSDAFAGHVVNAMNNRVGGWDWAEKERAKPVKQATKEEVRFQLRVVDNYQRIGGRPVSAKSTQDLKDAFGFRDVQSGNWVLKDPASARFHVEQTAGAMDDMGDILGIPPSVLGLGGRLAMAFGARGSGAKGWKDSAPRAHYEPVQRVINLTKMGGGGCLGHEYFHALDNMLGELVNQKVSDKKDDMVTMNPDLLPPGKIRSAVSDLRMAMVSGTKRLPETFKITPRDRALAKANLERQYLGSFQKSIKDAGSAEAAVAVVRARYIGTDNKRMLKQRDDWIKIAVAYFTPGDKESVTLGTGPYGSDFQIGALELDAGQFGKYWSKPEEMAARAFQAYLEDRMADAGRRNDYLSAMADNKYHVDPLFGIEWKPFPEGEERKRINAAFDKLFEVVRGEQILEKAAANKPLMDAMFPGFDPDEELADIIRRMVA